MDRSSYPLIGFQIKDSLLRNWYQQQKLTNVQTRDLKLLPKSVCGALTIWRTCRKKIYEIERISAVSSQYLSTSI
ncbi:hypothetical protein LguiA_007114 [Lonicera macranthoides]